MSQIINKNISNSQFLPENLFCLNGFYRKSSNIAKNADDRITQPVINRPNYFGFNKTDDDEILDYIRDLIQFDYQLEKVKLELLSYSDFSIHDAFLLFDSNKTGKITLKELKDGLKKIEIQPDNSDLFLLAHRFSSDGNNTLNFDEFTLLFIPFSGQPTKSQIKKSSYLGESTYLQMNYLTKKALANLMKQHLNIEFSLEQIRQHLAKKQVNIQRVFEKIDQNGSGLITADEFMNYLIKKKIEINRTILSSVMFRFDRNFSGKINRSEFLYEFKPKIRQNA